MVFALHLKDFLVSFRYMLDSFVLTARGGLQTSSLAAFSLAANSEAPFSTSTIRTVIRSFPNLLISPIRIFFAERSFPTCTAQACRYSRSSGIPAL